MADQILANGYVLQPREKVELYISGNTPLFVAPSPEDIRNVIDSAGIGVETFSGEVLEFSNITSFLKWYRISAQIIEGQNVGQLRANVSSVVDSALMTYWNVNVSEVRKPGNSVGDIISDILPEVPTSTAASLVAVAVIAVIVLVIIN